jgi:hypothetical protein
MIAAQKGNQHSARALIQRRADLKAKDKVPLASNSYDIL